MDKDNPHSQAFSYTQKNKTTHKKTQTNKQNKTKTHTIQTNKDTTNNDNNNSCLSITVRTPKCVHACPHCLGNK